jgi:stearoyl-CoA desaturase (delta-9 desaturase)
MIDTHTPARSAQSDTVERPLPGEQPSRPVGRFDQLANVVVMVVPPLALAFGAWQAWGGALRWTDLAAMAVAYTLTGIGVTVGFHRLFTHRSFRTGPVLRFTLGALGSSAIEGPLIEWVSNHRQHHRYSDDHGDPHSPHGHGTGFSGALRGLLHAHAGWILGGDAACYPEHYAKDLLADPVARFLDRTFALWALAGLALPFAFGAALTGSLAGGLTALLWAGAVRLFLLHHATFSINSLCHFFGTQPYRTGDESRNLAWLALPTMGEAWHNNHHAFPACARHGQRRWQLDPSWWVISALARAGLAWDVVGVSPARQAAKLA